MVTGVKPILNTRDGFSLRATLVICALIFYNFQYKIILLSSCLYFERNISPLFSQSVLLLKALESLIRLHSSADNQNYTLANEYNYNSIQARSILNVATVG